VEEHLISQAKAELMLTLSGDSHHYAHYLGNRDRHKITAGGGGAFLHGTNALPAHLKLRLNNDPDAEPQAFNRGPCYPTPRTSRLLALGAITLPLRNPTFVGVPAVMYLLLGWSVQFGLRTVPGRTNPLNQSGRNPVSALLLLTLSGWPTGSRSRPTDGCERSLTSS
jgi:hypothetical protein